jgi:dolichol-phosphate mannosyltransferase
VNEAPLRLRPAVRQALPRFAAVGLAGVGVNLAVLSLLHGMLGLPLLLSTAAATEVAIIGNYAGNELITFHIRRLNLPRLLRFNAASLAGLCLTVGTVWVLQHLVDWHYLVDELLAIGAGSTANFAINFGWTWGARPDQAP